MEKMEPVDRNERDDAQKAKIIFFSLVALVLILLFWSISSATKARSERNAATRELDAVKSDNIKLEQMVRDLNQENETLKKKVHQLEAKAKTKAKAKPASRKKAASKKSPRKKQVLIHN